MRKFNTVLLIIVVVTENLAAQTGANITDSIMSGGVYRSFIVYVPKIYNPSKAVPLLFNLHGLGSNKEEQEYYGDFRKIADTANFIMVLPNGTETPPVGRNWNNFLPIGTGVDDIGFISSLIDTISTRYSIDANRIYCTGMSNGAFMSYDLACFLSNRITAVASVTGSMATNHKNVCQPQHSTPIMEIHGTSDATVSYNGNGIFAEPVDSVVNYWVRFNHCSLTPSFTNVPNINTADNCTAEHYVFSGGDSGSSVELYKVIGGGHTWPGSVFPAQGNNTNQDFNASKEIWRFFSQYRLNKLASVPENTFEKILVTVYPNPIADVLTIQWRNNFSPDFVTVYDITGREIYSAKNIMTAEHFIINTSAWSSGIYLLSIENGKEVFHYKIVK